MVGSIILVLIGIASFFQNQITLAIDVIGDEYYIFKSDAVSGGVLILSGLICYFVIWKFPQKSSIVLKIIGVLYIVIGFLAIGHGDSYQRLLGIMHTDFAAGWLYLFIGLVVAVFGFTIKTKTNPTIDTKSGIAQG